MRMYKYKPFLSQESICNENDFQKQISGDIIKRWFAIIVSLLSEASASDPRSYPAVISLLSFFERRPIV